MNIIALLIQMTEQAYEHAHAYAHTHTPTYININPVQSLFRMFWRFEYTKEKHYS